MKGLWRTVNGDIVVLFGNFVETSVSFAEKKKFSGFKTLKSPILYRKIIIVISHFIYESQHFSLIRFVCFNLTLSVKLFLCQVSLFGLLLIYINTSSKHNH